MTMPHNIQTRRAEQAARAARDREALDNLARLLSASPRLGNEELIAAFCNIVNRARQATAPEQENTITMPEKKYIRPGETMQLELPYSEVCMHMRVAGSVMTVLLTLGDYPMAQLIKDDRPFSFPIGTGEAGLYQDAGGYYGYPASTSAQEGK